MSLLAIDVGNSNLTIGLFEQRKLTAHWRLQTDRERTVDEYGLTIYQLLAVHAERSGHAASIDAVAMASVVPPLTPTLRDVSLQWFALQPLEFTAESDSGMPICYEPIRDVGADRILNAVAAYKQYGGPCVIVDFGTATTFDAVSAKGSYVGGAISPGIGISMEALFQRASRLPRIELQRPSTAIGRTTVDSMQSGFVYGFAGQVREILARFEQELGPNVVTVATGGCAELIAREAGCIQHVNPWLTLEGLRLVWERNFQRG